MGSRDGHGCSSNELLSISIECVQQISPELWHRNVNWQLNLSSFLGRDYLFELEIIRSSTKSWIEARPSSLRPTTSTTLSLTPKHHHKEFHWIFSCFDISMEIQHETIILNTELNQNNKHNKHLEQLEQNIIANIIRWISTVIFEYE